MCLREDIEFRFKRHYKILFRPQDALFSELNKQLCFASHRAIVLWAFGFAEEIANELAQSYPNEPRPQETIACARLWACGKIKMPQARRAILACHALAKEISLPKDIALCHALGQACSTVHSAGHAMGLPLYELTAIVHRFGVSQCEEAIRRRVREYSERLADATRAQSGGEWATFL